MEQENIPKKSIFALLDENGHPVTVAFSTGNGLRNQVFTFPDFLKQQVAIAFNGRDNIPIYSAWQYDLPDAVNFSKLTTHPITRESLHKFIVENKGKVPYVISLRDACCMVQQMNPSVLASPEMLKMLNDQKYPSNEYKRMLYDYWNSFDREPSAVYAMQTGIGTFLTDNSGFGAELRRKFLQYIGDNFYKKEVQDLQYIQQYRIENPAQKEKGWAAYAFRKFNPSNGAMFSLDVLRPEFSYSDKQPLRDPILLQPTHDSYLDLVTFNDVQLSPQSNAVRLLLFTREHYYPDNFSDQPDYFRQHFQALELRQMDWEAHRKDRPSSEYFEIKRSMRTKATEVLANKYGITPESPYITEKQEQIKVKSPRPTKKQHTPKP